MNGTNTDEFSLRRDPRSLWRMPKMRAVQASAQNGGRGFSNRWYPPARGTATWHTIGRGPAERIRVVDAPHFVATTLEASHGRGDGDFYHHDMEDLLAVDGRRRRSNPRPPMTNTPSPDALDGWLRLADALDASVSTDSLDLELLVQQSQQAARGLRSLVAAVRASKTGDAGIDVAASPGAPEAPEDEIWVPDGMGGGMRMKVKPPTDKT